MPSIQDVADQINAKLDQISQNTANTSAGVNTLHADLGSVNAKLDALDTHLQAGLADVSSGLFAIWEQQKLTNSMLEHQTKQNDAILCTLENATELLCGITRKLSRQLDLSEQLVGSLKRVEGITERVNPGAAGDFDRLVRIQEEIRSCCPPEEAEPEPCPEACEKPKEKPYRPKGQDWSPSLESEPIG
jgi:uncharacterized protein YoxC